ncbi:MAG: holo-ACP synthase [Planctomycetaceae bacterium]|jgi:holo-[acyl-carrier protein] synthase|nr:holo-ACP synthase [Planctomycetaceae bacterium]
MNIIGIGTDIIECERIERMIQRHGSHFTDRVFTACEIRYCTDRKSSDQHFAGRWAAKEAVLKSLGTGWISGIAWTDVEVVNEPSGAPRIHLHSGAAKIAGEKRIAHIQISISHCKSHAIAFAAAIGETENESLTPNHKPQTTDHSK